MPKPPAIREDAENIYIDQKRGQWPFAQATRLDDGKLLIGIDCNEGGQVVGTGAGIAALVLSPKKAKRLREFLQRTEQ